MSNSQLPTIIETEEELRERITETFEPYTKSRQHHGIKDGATADNIRHTDGRAMQQQFHMKPLHKLLDQKEDQKHPIATQPRAFIDPLVHVTDHDTYLVDEYKNAGVPVSEALQEFPERYPQPRRKLLEWLAEEDGRLNRLNKGGTDVYLHGQPGSTKTTCMQYLTVRLMEANNETCVWPGSLGRSEWITLAPWTTVAFPAGVERTVRVSPFNTKIDPFEIDITDIARDVIEYENPNDLMRQFRDRPDGQLYVVYPDPKLRKCEYLTGWNYTNIWEAESMQDETPLVHWWFAWLQSRVEEGLYDWWTTLLLDEADELLPADASKDDQHTYQKVMQFKDTFRDARKSQLTLELVSHDPSEIHPAMKKKLRWTLTMNQEELPDDAPTDGDFTKYYELGEGMIWKAVKYASFSWPNMSRFYDIPAKVVVEYPDYDREKDRTAVSSTGGEEVKA